MRALKPRRAGVRSVLALVAALLFVGGLAVPSSAYTRPGSTELVSVGADGTQMLGQGGVLRSAVSNDGRYVAFQARGIFTSDPGENTNLPTMSSIYVKDHKTGRLVTASRSSQGLPAVGVFGSMMPSVSGSGRFIAFESDSPNLVSGDTNATFDIFVHDLKTRSTERVSIASDGEEASGESYESTIDATGRYVAFISEARNLVPGDTNDQWDVFVHDRKTGETRRASVASDGKEADGGSSCRPSISAGGNIVAFTSNASNLVDDDTNLLSDVFIHDFKKRHTERISVSSSGEELVPWGASNCGLYVNLARFMSDDGRFVGFTSASTNVVPNDSSRYVTEYDVFVRDRKLERTERISVTSWGAEPSQTSDSAEISRDGRFVVFQSHANDLAPGQDTGMNTSNPAGEVFQVGGDLDIYIHDRWTGATEMISVTSGGNEVNCDAFGNPGFYPALGGDGRFVSFTSCAALAPSDQSTQPDIFLRDRGPVLGALVGPDGPGTPPGGICITPETCIPSICLPTVCIPPGGQLKAAVRIVGISAPSVQRDATLYSASLAYRPQYSDLFAKIELEHMPKVIPGASPIFYGLRFKSGGKSYEVRAASLTYGIFGLFDCTDSFPCTKIADLKGGYGTTGMRVVFSLPLDAIGLKDGGKLKDVEAFSGLGSYLTGAKQILDRVELSR